MNVTYRVKGWLEIPDGRFSSCLTAVRVRLSCRSSSMFSARSAASAIPGSPTSASPVAQETRTRAIAAVES